MMMRAYHRWFGLASAVFMIFVAATGLGLQIDLWITGNPVPGSELPQSAPTGVLPASPQLEADLARMIAIARIKRPDLPIQHVDISVSPTGDQAQIGAAGPFGPQLTLDLKTGAVLPQHQLSPGWHGWLQDLHAGYRFGLVGRIISALIAVSLLVLGITGLFLYMSLYSKRRKAGRSAMFWKH